MRTCFRHCMSSVRHALFLLKTISRAKGRRVPARSVSDDLSHSAVRRSSTLFRPPDESGSTRAGDARERCVPASGSSLPFPHTLNPLSSPAIFLLAPSPASAKGGRRNLPVAAFSPHRITPRGNQYARLPRAFFPLSLSLFLVLFLSLSLTLVHSLARSLARSRPLSLAH